MRKEKKENFKNPSKTNGDAIATLWELERERERERERESEV